ncbi:MAG: hypothetical protein HYY02_03815 [Chloroflexi bacterium]|nr:hypothetical protein [Chloroflexota bacterium]
MDANIAWVMDTDHLLRTIDGGTTWIAQNGNLGGGSAAVALDKNTAWAVGSSGRIFRTTNGGTTWGRQQSGTTETLNDITAVSPSTAWAASNYSIILKTTDGGLTWVAQNISADANLYGAAAVNNDVAWAVGWWWNKPGSIFKTTNGGDIWVLQASLTGIGMISITAIDANIAVAVGEPSAVLVTTDGGLHWKKQTIGTTAHLQRVGSAGNSIWVVGESGTILHASLAGQTLAQKELANSVVNENLLPGVLSRLKAVVARFFARLY